MTDRPESQIWTPDRHAVRVGVALSVALVYLTLRLRGVGLFTLVGDVTMLLTYPAAVLLGGVAVLWLLSRRPLRLYLQTTRFYVIAVAFTVWIALGGVGGPDPLRSLTLVGIHGMALLLLLGVSTFVRDRATLALCNRFVYGVGALLAVVGLAWYLAVLAPWIPAAEPFGVDADNWAVIYMETNGSLLRYTGFVGDPNFYPYYASLSPFCGLVPANYRNTLNIVGLGALQVTILLAMSRTFFGTTAAAIAAVAVLYAFARTERVGDDARLRFFALLSGLSLSALAAVAARYPAAAAEWVNRRLFGALLRDKRFTETWPTLLDGIVAQPILGHGSRSVETMLGQTAHSAIFGLWYDFGLVGLLLWLALWTYTTRATLAVSLRSTRLALPWLLALLVSMGMNVMNSFQYDLFLWLLFGVAVAPGLLTDTSDQPTDGADARAPSGR